MDGDRQPVEEILVRVEARLLRTQIALGATALALGAMWLASFSHAPEVIRARGLVIEDAAGKARILIGAPLPETVERARKDAATGLVVLDAAGVDRLQIGNVGGPMMGGKVQPRVADAVGLMINDPRGNERAGFRLSRERSGGLGARLRGRRGDRRGGPARAGHGRDRHQRARAER
jgi:hypothetical protein